VNVVVQDGHGHAVTDLTPADFTILEDGVVQPIEVFNIEASRAEAPSVVSVPPQGASTVERRAFSNRETARPGGVTVVMFDRLNTTFEDQHKVRDQIVEVLGSFRREDRVALYVLESDTIRILHDFTGDTAALRAALARFRPKTSRETQATDAQPLTLPTIGIADVDAEFAAWLRETTRQVSNEVIRKRAQYTMDAFEGIARRLAPVRGRKNLVWVSSAFPLTTYDRFGSNPSDRVIDRAARAINDANVAVYAVDPRGLVTPTANAASMPTQEVNRLDRSAVADAALTGVAIFNPTQQSEDAMQLLSSDTGGRAFHSTNDVGKAIRQAVEDSRFTYLLGYHPSHGVWDGQFRSIKVTVNRPGVKVLSRKGYVATLEPALVPDMSQEALLALVRSPFEETGIDMSATVERLAAKSKAGAPQVDVAFRLDGRALTLERKGEDWEGTIDVVFALGTKDGRTFKTFSARADLLITAEQYDHIARNGFTMTQTIALRPDVSNLRVVVRDVPSGATGSLIIPMAASR
jgi:VWFA-related protein